MIKTKVSQTKSENENNVP